MNPADHNDLATSVAVGASPVRATDGESGIASEARPDVSNPAKDSAVRADAPGSHNLRLVPITQTEAFDFIERHHRHSIRPVGSIFQMGLTADGETICGVAVVGRPVARALDADAYTAEVTRLCTDGTKNACSKLYAACWRAARAMGCGMNHCPDCGLHAEDDGHLPDCPRGNGHVESLQAVLGEIINEAEFDSEWTYDRLVSALEAIRQRVSHAPHGTVVVK